MRNKTDIRGERGASDSCVSRVETLLPTCWCSSCFGTHVTTVWGVHTTHTPTDSTWQAFPWNPLAKLIRVLIALQSLSNSTCPEAATQVQRQGIRQAAGSYATLLLPLTLLLQFMRSSVRSGSVGGILPTGSIERAHKLCDQQQAAWKAERVGKRNEQE